MAGSSITVSRYVPADAARWDAFVQRSRIPHFLLQRGYMDYHADRFPDHSLIVQEDGVLRALLPATRRGDLVSSHGGLTFGGLVTDRSASVGRVLSWLDAIAEALRADGVTVLRYKPIPHIYHVIPAEEELYALYRLGAQLVQRDLSASVALDRRLPYSKGRKASVKKARLALHVDRDADVRGFWPMEEAWLRARHEVAPVHSGDEMAMLAERFPDELKLFTARNADGALQAGIVVYETARVAHAQYIATTEDGLGSGAIDAVVDHLLESVYADKPWFDFGISTVAGDVLNTGLARNKESYGARGVAYDAYELRL